jgi:hypothetical protein
LEEVAPRVLADERAGMWCLVEGVLQFVPADGGIAVTGWDDMLEYAQFKRYVAARPERVHTSWDSAVEFVRSRLLANEPWTQPTPCEGG